MAHLSIVGSHKVNGVSALHSELLVQDHLRRLRQPLARALHQHDQRRHAAALAGAGQPGPGRACSTARSASGWRLDLDQLQAAARAQADDAGVPRRSSWPSSAPTRRAWPRYIERTTGIAVDPASLFDVQVKRIHEYKRQLLNLLHVVTRYQAILANPSADWVPRTVIFAGKAASSYHMAKPIIRLIHDVGQRHQQRPARRRPAEGGVRAELRRVGGRAHHARRRPVGADLHRRHRGLGHRQHEAGAQRRADHRHRRRRQHRDPPERGRRQHLHLRPEDARGARRCAQSGYQPMRYLRTATRSCKAVLDAIAGGAVLARRAGALPRRWSIRCCGAATTTCCWPTTTPTSRRRRASTRCTASPAQWARTAIANVAGMGVFSSDRTIREYAQPDLEHRAAPER